MKVKAGDVIKLNEWQNQYEYVLHSKYDGIARAYRIASIPLSTLDIYNTPIVEDENVYSYFVIEGQKEPFQPYIPVEYFHELDISIVEDPDLLNGLIKNAKLKLKEMKKLCRLNIKNIEKSLKESKKELQDLERIVIK